MRKIALILYLGMLFLGKASYSQEYDPLSNNDNFYDFVEYWFDSLNFNFLDTSEGGNNSNAVRLRDIWVPRLSPSGDASLAAEAFMNYCFNFQPSESNYSPNWTCLGPSDLPENGDGIGRMHRIEFDPFYTGSNNLTIYASSGFGGLWRTLNDGASWENVNTDLLLPTTSVGDIAIDPNSSDTIFITTGLCDEGIIIYEVNTGKINPIFTLGVFRSDDFGTTWNNITQNIAEDFESGVALRRIVINPNNSNQVFICGSNGIYRTNDALSLQPEWNHVLNNTDINDNELYGLVFRPSLPYETIIASGRDIYLSVDEGDTWNSITGPSTGLDLNDLPNNFVVSRINIAVTAANPNKLLAYIVGKQPNGPALYIWEYNFTTQLWKPNPIYYYLATSLINWVTADRIAFVISPVNEYEFFFGTTKLWGTRDYRIHAPEPWSPYSGGGFHADIHGLEYNPIDTNKIICAHDGGISEKDLSITQKTGGWSYKYNGLQVSTMFVHDFSNYNDKWIGTGHQDNGYMFLYNDNGTDKWFHVIGGDGYGIQNLKIYPELFFAFYYAPSSPTAKNKVIRYDYLTQAQSIENVSSAPFDGKKPTERAEFVKSFQVRQHPQKDSIYMGLTELYKRKSKLPPALPEVAWENRSDIAKNDDDSCLDGDGQWRRQIIDFEISEADTNYIYIVTLGIYNGEVENWDLESHLFYSSTGMNFGDYWDESHFDCINFPGNGQDPFPVITAVEVNPTDPHKIWITFSGFVQGYKVWSYYTTTDTWINEDPNNSLNNLPVNDIVYQPGTNDRLYIATDAGIYVKDSTMTDWEKYGDFPNVRVTELKIDYCANKLRAATFGRGLWEGDLLPSTGFDNERIISEDITWDGIQAMTKDLRITSTGKLTISNTLCMPYMSKIIVERGGEIVIDGGKITNNCGKMWQGIQVWGTATASQSTPGAQGKLTVINGGAIEHAIAAVRVANTDGIRYVSGYEGGIIQTDDAHFINNRIGVRFYPYRNLVLGVEMDNLSYFYNTEFLTNSELADESIPENFLYFKGVKGIKVKGCTLSNTRPEEEAEMRDRGVGIYSEDADFTVTDLCINGSPCTEYKPTTFTNLNYGIKAFNLESTKTFEVSFSDFFNNLTGIYCKGIDYQDVFFNDFELYNVSLFHGPNDIFGGLYLDDCTGFTVEENNFYNDDEYDPPNEIRSIGITVNDSRDNLNMIYRNTFNRLHIGILAQNQNRGVDYYTGLKLKCNQFSNNAGDIAVTGDGSTINQGISRHQGANSNPITVTSPAGNLFSHAATTYSDFNNTLRNAWVNYYSHYGSSSNPWIPVDFQNISVYQIYPYPPSFDIACPPHFFSHGGYKNSSQLSMDETELRSMMVEMENLRDSAANELMLWIDAGNTQELNYEVESSTPDESLDLYEELMADSPYLSDSVLATSIAKENVLINAMIKDIMVANPHGVKKEELVDALEQRVPPIPDYMMAEILSGLDSLAQKEQRESEIAWYVQERDLAFNGLMNIYLKDEQVSSNFDSVASLIFNSGNLNSHYYLAKKYLESGDISEASSLLNNLPNQFIMDEEKLNEHQDFTTLFTIIGNILQQELPLDSLDNSSRIILTQIAEHGSRAASIAQNILQSIDTLNYPEVYILPTYETFLRRYGVENQNTTSGSEEQYIFQIYPNPTRDYFIIDYYFKVVPKKAIFTINDQLGKILEEGILEGQQNQLLRKTTSYSSGLYTINFYINSKFVKSQKFNVIR